MGKPSLHPSDVDCVTVRDLVTFIKVTYCFNTLGMAADGPTLRPKSVGQLDCSPSPQLNLEKATVIQNTLKNLLAN